MVFLIYSSGVQNHHKRHYFIKCSLSNNSLASIHYEDAILGYRDLHYKPKMVWRYNGNPYTDKMASS